MSASECATVGVSYSSVTLPLIIIIIIIIIIMMMMMMMMMMKMMMMMMMMIIITQFCNTICGQVNGR